MNDAPALPTDEELRRRFGRALADGLDLWPAIVRAIPDSLIYHYPHLRDRWSRAELWKDDEIVRSIRAGEDSEEGGRADLKRLLWAQIQACVSDPDALARLVKEYRELNGWVSSAKTDVTITPGVMIVPAAESDADWERRAAEQQAALSRGPDETH